MEKEHSTEYLIGICHREKINISFQFLKHSCYENNSRTIWLNTDIYNYIRHVFSDKTIQISEEQTYILAHELGHYFVRQSPNYNVEEIYKINFNLVYYFGLTKDDKENLIKHESLAWDWAEKTVKNFTKDLKKFYIVKEKCLNSYHEIKEFNVYSRHAWKTTK